MGDAVRRVPRVTALEFLREYVANSKPVVITDAISHWPALRSWTPARLAAAMGAAPVTVALTPDGRADAPALLPDGTPAFMLPYHHRDTLEGFFSMLHASQLDPSALVPYLQHQNSSLTEELPQLLGDVDEDLPWATEAFGKFFQCSFAPCHLVLTRIPS